MSHPELTPAAELPTRSSGLRRLMIWIIPANFAIFMIWGAVPSVLLPEQVRQIVGEGDKLAAFAVVSTLGAFAAMLAQPIAGQLSDRTRARFGRRAPWILAGALAGALSLTGLAFADSIVGIAVAWTLVQIFYNAAQGPLSALLPDRVPVERRGTFSALSGLGLMVGILGGQVIGALLFDSLVVGYLLFAALSVVTLILFLVFNPDASSTSLTVHPFRMKDFLATFWVNPVRHPDFFWAFLGRLLLCTAFYAVTGLQLYLLQDYLGVEAPETVIPMFSLLSLAGLLVATLISGPLSDRVGRRKPFVFASAVTISIGIVFPWVWPDLTAWTVMMIVGGFGFGMFQAVDTALMSQVLPSEKSFAKDLGIINIASTLPQTVAPGVAGAVALLFGYRALFPVAIVLGLLGAVSIWPIRSAR